MSLRKFDKMADRIVEMFNFSDALYYARLQYAFCFFDNLLSAFCY